MFEPEEWKTVPENDHYAVSNYGRIKNKDTGYILRPQKKEVGKRGDCHIQLSAGGVKTMCLVARLVAEAFLPEFQSRYSVIHQDGDYTNNHVNNLIQDHRLGPGKPPRNS
jgi:hypothetical protein